MPVLDQQQLIDNFNGAAGSYEISARLQKYVGEQLFDRLEFMKIDPGTILDLGAGPGQWARMLEQKFSGARIVQLDVAERMLNISRKNAKRFFSRQSYVCADADSMPIKDEAIEFVFSNLMLQWSQDTDKLLNEMARVIRPNGLFVFSTLGPDTLRELRESWSAADDQIHVNAFIDMHDLGDALVRSGFSDPVMEVEIVSLSYADLSGLMRDLKGLGARNVNSDRRRTLTGKGRYKLMQQEYEKKKTDGKLPATYEVIYGHAWMPDAKSRSDKAADGLFRISLEQLKQTLKKRDK